MSEALGRILQDMARRVADLERFVVQVRQPHGLPGYKHNFFSVISFNITSTDTTWQNAEINISPAGPFVWTGAVAAYFETAGGQAGEFRPVSSITDTASPQTMNSADFEFQFSMGGSGWKFQNKPIGSPMMFSNFDRPMYQPVEYLMKGNEALSVQVRQTRSHAQDGRIYVVVLGYKILNVNALGDLGQGAPTLDEIPGLRLPRKYDIPIVITSSSATTQTGSVTVSATGLFCATSIGATFRNSSGRYRGIGGIIDDTSAAPTATINCTFTVMTTGNDLRWQNDPLPITLLFSNHERPLYLPAPAIITPNSTVQLELQEVVGKGFPVGQFDLVLDGYTIVQDPP